MAPPPASPARATAGPSPEAASRWPRGGWLPCSPPWRQTPAGRSRGAARPGSASPWPEMPSSVGWNCSRAMRCWPRSSSAPPRVSAGSMRAPQTARRSTASISMPTTRRRTTAAGWTAASPPSRAPPRCAGKGTASSAPGTAGASTARRWKTTAPPTTWSAPWRDCRSPPWPRRRQGTRPPGPWSSTAANRPSNSRSPPGTSCAS